MAYNHFQVKFNLQIRHSRPFVMEPLPRTLQPLIPPPLFSPAYFQFPKSNHATMPLSLLFSLFPFSLSAWRSSTHPLKLRSPVTSYPQSSRMPLLWAIKAARVSLFILGLLCIILYPLNLFAEFPKGPGSDLRMWLSLKIPQVRTILSPIH